MMAAVLAAAALLSLAGSCLAAETCDQSVTVVSPRSAVPGWSTAVLVTLSGGPRRPPRAANVTVSLLDDGQGDEQTSAVIARSSALVQGQAVIALQVPAEAAGSSCLLQTTVDCGDGRARVQSTSALSLSGPLRHALLTPDRNTYFPGDTVRFWLLALDHSLRLPAGVGGTVLLRDSNGNAVATWPLLDLHRGVLSFSLPLSGAAPLGVWLVQLVPDGGSPLVGATFNVTSPDGGGEAAASSGSGWGAAVPPATRPPGAAVGGGEVAMAEEHFVELRFGRGVRRLYKPGLPFVGKVESVSTEKVVRVRVKLYDNTTAIYSQDLEITSGEATFVVPAILADSDLITLQAELVSVGGKEIDSHYVLAREPVRRWPGSNTPEDCYLLVQGLEKTLQPEERAHATVLSTCPCERDVHVLVTSPGGHVAYWATKQGDGPPPPDQRPPPASVDGAAICRLNFSFTVQAVMAPVSQLLVYYVTEEGEPVSDVISFDVRLQHKDVSVVSAEQRSFWLPGQRVPLTVSAPAGSLVCVVGGRQAGGGGGGAGGGMAPSSLWSDGRGGMLDFQQAGVAVFQRRCRRPAGGGAQVPSLVQQAAPAPAASDAAPSVDLGVDHVWLWRCFNLSESQTHHRLSVAAPESPGQWVVRALSLPPQPPDPRGGLRLSRPLSLTVFRPLSVAFSLPPSLRVGETAQVDVRIGNSASSCMDVTALLSLTEGAHFVSSGLLYVSEKLRLGPHGATSLVVRVVVTTAGLKNMTVEVSGSAGDSCRDSPSSGLRAEDRSGQSSSSEGVHQQLTGSVVRAASTLVRAEGLRRTATDSAYFCANERLMVSTPTEYRYEWMAAPRNRPGVVFEVRSSSPGGANMALSAGRFANDDTYQLVIGDRTWISKGPHAYGVRLASAETPGLLTSSFRPLWVSWEGGVVSVGRGSRLHQDTVLQFRPPSKRDLKVTHLGLGAPWGTPAEFRLWNYNEEAGFSQVLHLQVPRPVVPGSEQGSLTVSGGLALPASASTWVDPDTHATRIGSASSLTATLASFSPLPALSDGWQAPSEVDAGGGNLTLNPGSVDRRRQLSQQLQALLVFRKGDGSFGDHPTRGSHRSTVWALQVLRLSQTLVPVDSDLVTTAKRWLQARQRLDGSFPSDDGTDGDVETTSETLVALLDVGLESEKDESCAKAAQQFLERASQSSVVTPLQTAALAMALVASNSQLAPAALEQLKNASANEEGDFGWPDASTKTQPHEGGLRDLYLRAEADMAATAAAAEAATSTGGQRRVRDGKLPTSSAEYRASLYALTAFSMSGDLRAAEPVARYLYYRTHLLDDHPELLFLSVSALWRLSRLSEDSFRSLTVSLATSGMELTDTMELTSEDRHSRTLPLPSLPTKVFVYATGAGCATVQGRVSYSSYSPVSQTPLLDLWAGADGGDPAASARDRDVDGRQPDISVRVCFRWKARLPCPVVRLEVSLFSGFQLSSWNGVVLLDRNGTRAQVQHGSRADRVWFVFSDVTSRCPLCVRFSARGVFSVTSLRPAFARVYPADQPHLAAETFFHSEALAAAPEEDMPPWFGPQGGLQTSSNFSEVCECGADCQPEEVDVQQPPATTTQQPASSSETTSESSDWTTDSGQATSTTREPDAVNIVITDDSDEPPAKTNRTAPLPPASSPHTINKERSRPPPKLLLQQQQQLPKQLDLDKQHPQQQPQSQQPQQQQPPAEQLFVLDRDTLWGMLREVVHVELSNHTDNHVDVD